MVAVPRGAFRISGAALRLWIAILARSCWARALTLPTRANWRLCPGADVVITVDDTVVASTLPRNVTAALAADAPGTEAGIRMLAGEEYATRLLLASGPATIYTLASIDAAVRAAEREALMALGSVAFGGFVLAALGSFWLARTLTGPIDRLSGEIAMIAASRDLGRMLPPTGKSRELDALAEAFNELLQGITAAEAETRVGVYRFDKRACSGA